ncbi:cation efflux protein [Durotheca rogersii]|uniref:cation efflux protein n=1 Tax=Durotheca rogersii TaxID=419775 RepID=UPI00221FDD30|nr:cation efflux protein [Durotheca rogersii]KAI5862002.1 cation efflux protein [Durotheca rogersii]
MTMAWLRLSSKQTLYITIGISFTFFIAEIVVAFYTRSLALLADAFHYMNDLIGFIVALVAIVISESAQSPKAFSFGWARAQLLGAFFNGVFLFALGISILLQSIERFIFLEPVENPKLVLILGCVGLALNIISAAVLHEHSGHGHSHAHDHGQAEGDGSGHSRNQVCIEAGIGGTTDVSSQDRDDDDKPPTPTSAHAEHRHTITTLQSPGRDLGMMGVLIHVLGDAANNVGVIAAALTVWLAAPAPGRFYADPAVGAAIAAMILATSVPLVKNSGRILMQSAPHGVDLGDVKHDLEKIPGIESVHELHIWRLDQKKAIATAHVVVSDAHMTDFMARARTVAECLHAYGIHSATLQPELSAAAAAAAVTSSSSAASTVAVPGASSTEDTDRNTQDGGSSGMFVGQAGAQTSARAVAATAANDGASARRRRPETAAAAAAMAATCQIPCGKLCENLKCCNVSTGHFR